jgi:hypothetical protein
VAGVENDLEQLYDFSRALTAVGLLICSFLIPWGLERGWGRYIRLVDGDLAQKPTPPSWEWCRRRDGWSGSAALLIMASGFMSAIVTQLLIGAPPSPAWVVGCAFALTSATLAEFFYMRRTALAVIGGCARVGTCDRCGIAPTLASRGNVVCSVLSAGVCAPLLAYGAYV